MINILPAINDTIIKKLDNRYNDIDIDIINKDDPYVKETNIKYYYLEENGFRNCRYLKMTIVYKNACQYYYLQRLSLSQDEMYDDLKREIWYALGHYEENSKICESFNDIEIINDNTIRLESLPSRADVDIRHWIYM